MTHLEAVNARQPSVVWHKAVGQCDVCVLYTPQRNLVLDLAGLEALGAFLHNKRIHLQANGVGHKSHEHISHESGCS